MNQQEASQDVLRCDVCFDKEREKSPAEVHCNTCHTNVCGPCVAKHMTSNKSKKHDIVLLFSANTNIDLPVCPFHSTVKSELFCRRCIIPICLKCLISYHDGHGVEEIIELCKPICADIQKNTDNLKNKIMPKFEKLLVDEDEKLKRLIQEYDSFESSVEDHGQEINKSVDTVIKKYKAKAKEMKQTDVQILQQQKKEINELLSEVKQDAAHKDLLQRSRNVTESMAYEAKPTIDPILKIIIPPVFKPKLVSDDVLEGFFTPIPNSKVVVEEEQRTVDENKKLSAIGKFTDKPLFTFHTPFKQLLRVSCTRYGRLWTSGNDNMLRCLDMQNGSVVDSRTIPSNPIDICTNDNGIFVCDSKFVYNNRSSVDLKKCKNADAGWSVEALASSRVAIPKYVFPTIKIPMYILMFLRCEDRTQSKVVRAVYDRVSDGEFQYDSEGKDLYNSNSYDFFLAENKNGDICVSDTTALVVIDKCGKFRFRYHGKMFETFDKPFKPTGVTTDSRGNILLADFENRSIHLLDQDGHFIRYITCGGSLDKIIDVSCDENGRVWIAERLTAKIKCIKY